MVAVLRAAAAAGKALAGGTAVLLVFCSFVLVDVDRAVAWKDPETLWSRAVDTSPESWRSSMHHGVEAYKKALKTYGALDAKSDRRDPDSAFLEYRAKYLLDSALEDFTRSQELYPRAFETRLNLGNLHLYRARLLNRDADPDAPPPLPEEYREAIRWFALAEESSPGSFRALYQRATAMAEAGLVEEATREFERLAQDRSRTTMYAWPLASLYARAGRTADALAQLDLIESIRPGDAGPAALRRGEILTRAGRFREAEKELQRAATVLGIDDPGPPLYMARLLVATGIPGNLPAARTLWNAALERGHRPGPKDRAVVEAIR